jgi:hypothetical protein
VLGDDEIVEEWTFNDNVDGYCWEDWTYEIYETATGQ